MNLMLNKIKTHFPKVSISLPPLRILLIEDNPPEAYHIRKVLNQIGNVFWEEELESALKTASSEKLDLVLMTLTLAGDISLDAFDTLLRQHPEIPIIVLSDPDTKLLAEAALHRGAMATLDRNMIDNSDYLIKMITSFMIKAKFIQKAEELSSILDKSNKETPQTHPWPKPHQT